MKKKTLVTTVHHVDTHVEVTSVSVLPAGKVTIVMKVSFLCLQKIYISSQQNLLEITWKTHTIPIFTVIIWKKKWCLNTTTIATDNSTWRVNPWATCVYIRASFLQISMIALIHRVVWVSAWTLKVHLRALVQSVSLAHIMKMVG